MLFLSQDEGKLMPLRKSYPEAFKREAVQLAKERGNLSAAARDLGISDNTLHNWKSCSNAHLKTPSPATATRATTTPPGSSANSGASRRKTRS